MRIILSSALLAVVLAGPAAAQSADADAIRQRIEKEYGVTVLRIARTALENGEAGFIVTVMNPADAGNAAFQVNKLLVDPATGTLVPQFRHTTDGYRLPGAPRLVPNRTANPDGARSPTWR